MVGNHFSGVLFIVLLFAICSEGFSELEMKKHKNTCYSNLRDLAAFNANFTQCVIKNSAPVEMCEQCFTNFYGMQKFYNIIVGNDICKQQYFDQDRLNIVENMYLNSKNLWDKAFCENCFTYNVSIIYSLIEKVENCIIENKNKSSNSSSNHPNEIICSNCGAQYNDANKEFRNIDVNNKGKICFDIQDKMNRTRVKWSKELKCCRRTVNLDVFATISSLLLLLPILFYGGFFIYTKRTNAQQSVLSAADLVNENQQSSSTSTENHNYQNNESPVNNNEPEPSTSSHSGNNCNNNDDNYTEAVDSKKLLEF